MGTGPAPGGPTRGWPGRPPSRRVAGGSFSTVRVPTGAIRRTIDSRPTILSDGRPAVADPNRTPRRDHVDDEETQPRQRRPGQELPVHDRPPHRIRESPIVEERPE